MRTQVRGPFLPVVPFLVGLWEGVCPPVSSVPKSPEPPVRPFLEASLSSARGPWLGAWVCRSPVLFPYSLARGEAIAQHGPGPGGGGGAAALCSLGCPPAQHHLAEGGAQHP